MMPDRSLWERSLSLFKKETQTQYCICIHQWAGGGFSHSQVVLAPWSCRWELGLLLKVLLSTWLMQWWRPCYTIIQTTVETKESSDWLLLLSVHNTIRVHTQPVLTHVLQMTVSDREREFVCVCTSSRIHTLIDSVTQKGHCVHICTKLICV